MYDVCMYLCMHVCMYVHVCTCMYMYTDILKCVLCVVEQWCQGEG